MKSGFITSIEYFKPHTFQAEQGEGLFMSHAHEYDEITLILDGEGYYSSAEQNRKVSKGDLIFIPSQLHHGFVCTKPWKGISVHFLYDKIPAFCQYLFLDAYRKPLHIQFSRLEEADLEWAVIVLRQLEQEWKKEEEHEHTYDLMRNMLETVLLLYHRNMKPQQPAADKNEDGRLIDEVLKEIHRGYNTSLTIHEIAARHFLSESILRKKFLEALGVSPKQYIIHLRLNEAKRLLQQTGKAIEYIASEVGFTSSSRFYDLFVKSVGMTPAEWRRLNP